MQSLLDDCNDHEVRIAYKVAKAAVEAVRADEKVNQQ